MTYVHAGGTGGAPARAGTRAASFPDARGRFGPVRRPLRARDAGAGARAPRRGRAPHPARSRSSRPSSWTRAAQLGRPADAADPRAHAVGALGRRGLAQARGPRAHRRAQDQQRDRPGAAGQASRREAHRGRNRRRPAWRGDRRGLRAPRPALRRLHGRGRHRAPGAERRAHEAARRRGRAGDERRPDAARRHRRGAARLGVRPGTAPTTCWAPRSGRIRIRTSCASCSRSSVARRARRCWSSAGGLPDVAVACVGGGSNAIGLFHPFIGDAGVQLLGIEAGGRGPGLGDNAATLAYGRPGVLQGSYSHAAAGRGRPDPGNALGLGRARLLRASGPSTRCCSRPAACATSRPPTTRRSTRWPSAATPKASCRRSRRRTPLRAPGAGRSENPGRRILIGLSGRGDKDMPTLQSTLLKGKL